ncbi:LysR family transcriptional regulator [Marinomonas pollencensis]|uniref:DNA-binding transcriptional LysR family regulator n=1 Tax=Marinomonas pollencensis TaxID=491954 RepID=A0A3E0DMB0_9GAMM|nr:LysR family transcriptional regulator [Marinomonas pollencensis]REG83215.1 DNA-binding transcriptional LysR family regulator [Marinomonas pollencensis]
MDLKPLKSFVTVATLKSFSAAARELNTVQPAISRHIAALEEELGISLFIRNTRDVSITAAGLQLLQDANTLLKQVELSKRRAQKAAQGELGVLRVGYLPSACLTFIPDLVQRFRSQYPEVDISLYEMTASAQIIAFLRDEIDVGISRPLPIERQAQFSSQCLYRDYLSVVVPEGHPLAERERVKLDEITQESIILFQREEAVGLFDGIIKLCRQNQFSPQISAQPKHMQTMLTMVAAGLGVAIAPTCIAKLYTQGCRFVRIDNDDTEVLTQIHYDAAKHTPTALAFTEIAMAAAEQIQQGMADIG